MISVARWSLALTSTLAVLAATAFAAGYISIEMNDVRYKRVDDVLPVATKSFAQTAPWMGRRDGRFGSDSGGGSGAAC
jgi:hypothetical protein